MPGTDGPGLLPEEEYERARQLDRLRIRESRPSPRAVFMDEPLTAEWTWDDHEPEPPEYEDMPAPPLVQPRRRERTSYLPLTDTVNTPTRDEWRYITETVMAPDTPPERRPMVNQYSVADPRYPVLLRMAFNFLLRHASRRYSDSSMMRVRRAADRIEGMTVEQIQRTNDMPFLVVAELASGYDEETEVKIGGVVGLAVCWEANDGKTLLAVHEQHRRRKIGTVLLRVLREYRYLPHFWVGRANQVGQQFLVANGTFPLTVNGNGAICYGFGEEEEG